MARTYNSGKAQQLVEKLRKAKEKIDAEVLRNAGRGLNAMRVFITARVREKASVRAVPRFVRVLPGGGREFYTTTPAVQSAPLRLLSGRFRGSITSYMDGPTKFVIGANARSRPTRLHPQGFPYVLYHEKKNAAQPGSGKHQTFAPTFEEYKVQMRTIVGQEVKKG